MSHLQPPWKLQNPLVAQQSTICCLERPSLLGEALGNAMRMALSAAAAAAWAQHDPHHPCNRDDGEED